jgi:peptidoglycan/LPS O-acetylase OafA/YrhL
MRVDAPVSVPRTAGRASELDGLRALATALVFVYHFGLFTVPWLAWGDRLAAPTTWGARIIPNLHVGVEIFFVLSGVLIYGPFVRSRLAATPSRGHVGPSLRRYALRRAARINPAYWLAVGVFVAAGDIRIDGAAALVQHLTLTQTYFGVPEGQGLAIAWTLVIEVSFYCFVPLWAWIVRRWSVSTEVATLAAMTVAAHGLRWFLEWHDVWAPVTVLPPALASLAPGMILAIVLAARDRGDPGASRFAALVVRYRVGCWVLAGVVAFVLVRVSYASVMFSILTGSMRARHEVLAPTIAVLVVAPVALGGASGRGFRWLRARGVVALGTVSYGVYLWHHPLMTQHLDVDAIRAGSRFDALLVMLGLGAIVVGIASLSWTRLERPVLELAERVSRRGRPSHEATPR